MKKFLPIILIALIIVIVYALFKQNDSQPTDDSAMMTGQEMMNDDEMDDINDDEDDMDEQDDMDDAMIQSSVYQNYDEAAVDAALAAGKKVALFFHANRCPTCRALDAEIQANRDELDDDVVIFKTDYDTQTELKQQYGVTTQHTLITLNQDKDILEKEIGVSFDGLEDMLE